MAFTSDDLVASIKRRAFLPDASDLDDADLLSLADEEMLTIIGDGIKSARGEHWLTSEDFPLTGATSFRLPRRVTAQMVRGVVLVLNDGTTVPIPQIDAVIGWAGASISTPSFGYYFRDTFVCFPAAPPSATALRIWYLRRPNKLVLTTNDGVAPIDHAPSTLSIETTGPVPTALQTAGTFLDIARGDAPYDLTYVDLRVESWDSGDPNVIVLSADTPVDTDEVSSVIGNPNGRQDYICLRDTTVYPPIPEEFFPVLSAAVVRRVNEILHDPAGTEVAEATLQRQRRAAQDLIQPRNEQGSKPLINVYSPLRSGGGWGRRRWR